ncbi:putative Hercynine oxygenase [Pillotina sp. SPG140]|jgi:formylglycine-generating enzyme required for sulfatase activity
MKIYFFRLVAGIAISISLLTNCATELSVISEKHPILVEETTNREIPIESYLFQPMQMIDDSQFSLADLIGLMFPEAPDANNYVRQDLIFLPFSGSSKGQELSQKLLYEPIFASRFVARLSENVTEKYSSGFAIIGSITQIESTEYVITRLIDLNTFEQIGGSYQGYNVDNEQFPSAKIAQELINAYDTYQKSQSDETKSNTKIASVSIDAINYAPDSVNQEQRNLINQVIAIEISRLKGYTVYLRQEESTALKAYQASALNVQPAPADYLLSTSINRFGTKQKLLSQVVNREYNVLFTSADQDYENIHSIRELVWKLFPDASGATSVPDLRYFTLVEGGSFLMGSNAIGENPVQRVRVQPFYMGITEVTQTDYLALTGTNPSLHKGAKLPVENISWYEAVEYCNKLSLTEGLEPAYRINSFGEYELIPGTKAYRLPTEAEWEFAARARGRASFIYAGANSVDEVAWYTENNVKGTQAVGSKKPNDLGLYDMSGNVGEWCQDYFDIYGQKDGIPLAENGGPAIGVARVWRGGSFESEASSLRTTARELSFPTIKYSNVGFRIARSY